MSNTKKQIIFSGMQPTGALHIGNYLGALKNWVTLQDEYDCIFCIVDYHSLTIEFDIKQMQNNIFNIAVDYLACGLDPKKCKIFIQSDVPQHTELAWILNTVTPMGELERMTQFKDKSKQHNNNINAGLFTYPVLQAADIVIYNANKVPVGEDQVQHVELTREIVRDFNHRYGNVLVEPKEMVPNIGRILGLDGKSKMSKSLGNHISLRDNPEEVKKKLLTAVTDENRKRKTDPGNPDICNVFTFHRNFTKDESVINGIVSGCKNAEIGCVDCKKILIENLNKALEPIQTKQNELNNNPQYVYDILDNGAKDCRNLAQQTIDRVKESLGLKR